jgi:hypothetical protein
MLESSDEHLQEAVTIEYIKRLAESLENDRY